MDVVRRNRVLDGSERRCRWGEISRTACRCEFKRVHCLKLVEEDGGSRLRSEVSILRLSVSVAMNGGMNARADLSLGGDRVTCATSG